MTREEALKILDTIPTIGEQVDALEMAIKALEQTRWIPVSEGLPEEDGYYLGCCGDNACSIVVDEFNKDHFCKYNIIAWMPLPQPYKNETQEREE